jgi:hypothetical protein
MRCRECDTPNPPERRHCSKCGAKLPPPPGKAHVAAEAPRAKPRPRPAEVEDDEEEERRVRRQAEKRAEPPRAKPRPRPAEDEYDEEEEERPVRRRAEERAEARRPRRPRREGGYDDEEDEDEEEVDAIEKVIPYHNRAALIAYYTGIVCLIPVALYVVVMMLERESTDALGILILPLPVSGMILGIATMVFGVIGLVKSRNDPRARGGGHAGFGLFMGLVTFLICIILWVLHAIEVLPLGIIKLPDA